MASATAPNNHRTAIVSPLEGPVTTNRIIDAAGREGDRIPFRMGVSPITLGTFCAPRHF